VVQLPDNRTLLVVARTDADGGCVDPSIGTYHEYIHSISTNFGRSWKKPTLIPGAGCVRPKLLALSGGAVLLSGGRQCWINKTDVLIWTGTVDSIAANQWGEYSLSYQHNNLWQGDPSLRFGPATVNGTYGGPDGTFLGTLSYTSLIPLGPNAGVVTYDLRLPEWHGIPSVQIGFSMRFRVQLKSDDEEGNDSWTVGKYMLLDPHLLQSVKGDVQVVAAEVAKDVANPMICEDQRWELTFRHMYASITRDNGTDWRCYYNSWLAPSKVGGTLLARSTDGLTWQKRPLGTGPYEHGDNNVVMVHAGGEGNVGVWRDERERNSSRRWKAFGDIDGGLGLTWSADGIHGWLDESVHATGMMSGARQGGDTSNNMVFDEASNQYLAFTRLDLSNPVTHDDSLRTSARSSHPGPPADLVAGNWSPAEVILDDGLANNDLQVYGARPFRYGHLWLAFVVDFEQGLYTEHCGGKTLPENTSTCGKMYSGLAASNDSRTWWRVLPPRQSFIPFGPVGSWDSMMTYPSVSPIPDDDGFLRIYYSGANGPHGTTHKCFADEPERRTCLGMARVRLDRFAGLWSAGPNRKAEVTVVTVPLKVTGPVLHISADAASGFVKVGLLGVKGMEVSFDFPHAY
jgi:hypothetical protein